MKTHEQIIEEFREKFKCDCVLCKENEHKFTTTTEYMESFILNLLKEKDREVKEMIESIDISTMTKGGFRRKVLSKLNPIKVPIRAGHSVCLRKNMGEENPDNIDNCIECKGPCTCKLPN